jgi:hypothetical protein
MVIELQEQITKGNAEQPLAEARDVEIETFIDFCEA